MATLTLAHRELNDVRRLIELQSTKRNELHGGPFSSAFARPFQSAVSGSRRAFAACCRPRSPGDVFFPGRDWRDYGFRFRLALSNRSDAEGAGASIAVGTGGITSGGDA